MNKKTLYIIFFFFCGILSAQNPIHFTVKEGLPSNQVYDVLEDKDGFMWFATNRGVAKYNGESFKTFTIKDGLPNNDVWLLDKDHKNHLWYFSKSAYQGYIKNDSIYKFKTEDNKVISPYVIKTDSSFIISEKNIYELNNKILKTKFKSDSILSRVIKLSSKNSFDIAFYNINTHKYVNVLKNELVFFDNNLNELKRIVHNLNLSKSKFGEFKGIIYKDLTVCYTNKGYLYINTNDYSYKFIPYSSFFDEVSTQQSSFKVVNNTFQITRGNWLFIFDEEFTLLEKYKLLSNASIDRAFKDSKGNIWMTSTTNGAYFLSKQQLESKYLLKGKPVKKLGVFNKQFIAGVQKEGFYKFKNNNPLLLKQFPINKGVIYHIKKDFLISSLKSYTAHKEKPIEYSYNNRDGKYSSLKDVIHFKKNQFISTAGLGIEKINISESKAETIQFKSGAFVLKKFKETIFAGATDGLWQLQNDSLVKSKSANSIINTSILTFAINGNYLYVGTDGRGVYAYDNNKLIHFKNTDDLSIQRIVKRDNQLWLATQKGVKVLQLNTNDLENSSSINNFHEADGLLQNNVNDIFLKDSSLYAATDEGLSTININNNLYKQKPNLYFKTKDTVTKIENKSARNLSVSFGVLNFSNQENITYQYRLLPTKKNWTSTNTKTLNFSSLKPKEYTLEVKATDQHLNRSIKAHKIIVKPLWFETIWAKIGYVFLALLGVYLLFKWNQKRIEKREQEKAEREKRMAGLELQALRSQMNPHFVHNSLNSIQYFIQRNEVEQSEDYLVKFSKLVRLFFEYSRRQTISILEEVDLLKNYLEIEKLRFEEKLNFTINVDSKIDKEEQVIPSMILQPIIENAVNHGLFHKKDNGKISIHFQFVDDQTFKVSIKDDGIGIKKSKEIYKNSSKNYQSNSTTVLQERLELLQQSKDWEITYQLQDLQDNLNQTGTLVSITFKQPML